MKNDNQLLERRQWLQTIATTAVALSAGGVSTLASTAAVAADYEVGKHYITLQKPQPVQTGSQIEVLELFWYGCPHCFDLEPHVKRWKKNMPDSAEYVLLPAVFRKSWIVHARAYYTFEALGQVDKLHEPFFDAIHKDRKQFTNADDLASWAITQGADGEQITSAFSSFAVDTKIQQAMASLQGYEATGVPTMVVDGKYSTSVSRAGGVNQLFDVVEFLITKAAGER